MQFSVQSIALFSLIASAMAFPGGETLRLDNGKETVNAVTGSSAKSLDRRGNLSCQGSAFCERLGDSCDDAFRQIEPGNTYLTGGNSGSTGVCSGTCGVFVSGDHCQVLGSQMQTSYNDIRNYGCSHCGWEQLENGCKVKIDRVTGC